MTRHFSIPNTSGRLTAGAHRQSSALRANTPRDPSIPAEYAQPRGNFSQTIFDIALIIVGAILGSCLPTALGLFLYALYLRIFS